MPPRRTRELELALAKVAYGASKVGVGGVRSPAASYASELMRSPPLRGVKPAASLSAVCGSGEYLRAGTGVPSLLPWRDSALASSSSESLLSIDLSTA